MSEWLQVIHKRWKTRASGWICVQYLGSMFAKDVKNDEETLRNANASRKVVICSPLWGLNGCQKEV